MRIPVPYNPSVIQKRNNLLDGTGILKYKEEQWVEKIKESFYKNFNYTQVTKNFDTAIKYDTWIYDGNKDEKVLGSHKKFLSYPYNPHIFEIGDYVSYNYGGDIHNWLITSLDKQLYYNVNGQIERCNINLVWIDKYNQEIKTYPAVVKDELKRALFNFNQFLITPQGYLHITVQVNNDTKTIKINQRFLFGDPYQAFKVTALVNYTDTNTMGLELMLDQISPEDDFTNGIANGLNIPSPSLTPTSGNIITPDTTDITQNTIITYTVQHLVNNVADSNTFSIVGSGADSSLYNLTIIDGNHFSVESLGYTGNQLVVTCTNDNDETTIIKNINLKGLW